MCKALVFLLFLVTAEAQNVNIFEKRVIPFENGGGMGDIIKNPGSYRVPKHNDPKIGYKSIQIYILFTCIQCGACS